MNRRIRKNFDQNSENFKLKNVYNFIFKNYKKKKKLTKINFV